MYIGKRIWQGFSLILHASLENLFWRCLLSFKILVMGREKGIGKANFL